MFDHTPKETTLKLGRPDNRRYTYKGDKRYMTSKPALMGPDAHGVYWMPVRSYWDEDADTTLVVFAPVHPDDLKLAAQYAQLSQGDSVR